MANHWAKAVWAAAAACALGAPAAAQEPLALKPGAAWTHPHSGITVPATLAETPRANGMAFAANDLDVGLSFVVGDAVESLSVYIFRDTNGAVPIWFAQAQWGIENRGTFGRPVPIIAPQAFVPPHQTTASGLKTVYEPKGGPYRSTGVVLLPVGDWYVKIRASSQTRSPAELDAWMTAALDQIRWPGAMATEPVAVPVTPCPTPLSFPREAKDARKDSGNDLLNAVLGQMVAEGKVEATPESKAAIADARWCRDSSLDGNAAVYRRDAATDAYLIAVGDNGNGIWVGPDAGSALLGRGKKSATAARWSIVLMTAAENVQYVAQDRLPSPRRVQAIVEANRVTSSVSTWGGDKTITINSKTP